MLMSSGNHMGRACFTVTIIRHKKSEAKAYHTLKVAISLVDTKEFIYYNGGTTAAACCRKQGGQRNYHQV
jgi:hypothetical protein